jgi:hypothetical protein
MQAFAQQIDQSGPGDEFRSDSGDEEFGCKEGISQLFILEEHLYEQL